MVQKLQRFFIIFLIILIILTSQTSLGYLEPELENNFKQISPMETAVFPIEVTRKGDVATKINIKIEQIPEGWNAFINDKQTIGGNSKTIVPLTVIPPDDFGYHEDTAVIRVIFGKNISYATNITVMVESQGFSTKGIENLFLYFFMITVFLIFFIKIFKRKLLKNKKEKEV